MKKIIIASALLSFTTSTLLADQFASAPGTKARAMGYAFSAVANNTSAAYYNPAGYTQPVAYRTGTIEFGNASSWDATEDTLSDAFSDDTQYFLGYGRFSPEGGWGWSLYSLFDIYRKITKGSETKAIHQSNEVIHFASSWSLGSNLSFGLGAAYVTKLFSSDTEDDSYSAKIHKGYELEEYEASGTFFNAGILLDVFKTESGNKLTLSATYRSEADMSEDDSGVNYTSISIEPYDIPEETVVGAAFHLNTDVISFLFTADKKETTYSGFFEGLSSETLATGVEIGLGFLTLRAGFYESTPINENTSDAYEVKGQTVGASFKIGGTYWEFASDNRKMDRIGSDNTFTSLSANWTF